MWLTDGTRMSAYELFLLHSLISTATTRPRLSCCDTINKPFLTACWESQCRMPLCCNHSWADPMWISAVTFIKPDTRWVQETSLQSCLLLWDTPTSIWNFNGQKCPRQEKSKRPRLLSASQACSHHSLMFSKLFYCTLEFQLINVYITVHTCFCFNEMNLWRNAGLLIKCWNWKSDSNVTKCFMIAALKQASEHRAAQINWKCEVILRHLSCWDGSTPGLPRQLQGIELKTGKCLHPELSAGVWWIITDHC